MTLMQCPPFVWSILCILTVFAYVGLAVCVIDSIRRRVWGHTACGFVLFAAAYLIHQMMNIIIRYDPPEGPYSNNKEVVYFLGSLPVLAFLFCTILLLLIGGFWMRSCLQWRKDHVSRSTIKDGLDFLPSGLLIYQDDGKLLLANKTMTELSSSFRGRTILNGNEFYSSVSEQGMQVQMEGRTYAFQHRDLYYKGEHLHELVADDETEIIQKTEELKKANADLEILSEKMHQYGLKIEETVRKKEILQAKINIHDGMNSLILGTALAAEENQSPAEVDTILSAWQKNALVLCRDAENRNRSVIQKDMDSLAGLIGLSILWEGDLKTYNTEVTKLFVQITREIMTNAVKHASATQLHVKLQEIEDTLVVTYTNNGRVPTQKIIPSGGLKNISNMLSEAGGRFTITEEPELIQTAGIPLSS